jgi:hypothetical protein
LTKQKNLIAAQPITAIVTNNTKHFTKIEGLRIDNWSQLGQAIAEDMFVEWRQEFYGKMEG